MAVDFEFKRAPSCTVASLQYVGLWREDHLHKEFRQLVAWAKKNKVRTGRWIFRELDGPYSRRPDTERRWEACLEFKGQAEREGRVRIKKLPAETVARVVFNPDAVSARLVYHGLSDWLRWRKKSGEIKTFGPTREVYDGDPWTNTRAWTHAEVQFLVRRK
jgi:DNA gyrase inhibitor GyrI